MIATLMVSVLGACTGYRDAASGYAPTVPQFAPAPRNARIIVTGTGRDPALDRLVEDFMVDASVPNAQLAVSSGGTMTFSHAYTYRSLAASTTATTTIMRLASNTKAWVDAALYRLITQKKVDPQAKVFHYLGITSPLPKGTKVDPRVYDITIEDMIVHKSGWDDTKPPYYDPTFHMRQIARALHLSKAVGDVDYVRYQLGKPLQENPGAIYAYCNFCYTVLGMVVAKASGMTFSRYIASEIAAPLGVDNVKMSPTVGPRVKHEVAKYYSDYSGLSAVFVLSRRRYGYPYGGDDMDLAVAGGASALATNAESMLKLMNAYLIWGVGTPEPGADWAREGSMAGTNTWAEQLPNGVNYAFLVNTRQYTYGKDPNAFTTLQSKIEGRLDP